MAWPFMLVLHIAATALLLVITIVASYNVLRSLRSKVSKSSQSGLYEDEDGTASEESQKAYSIKLQNTIALIITTSGFAIALSNAILVTIRQDPSLGFLDGWLRFGLWALLLLQRIQVLQERKPVQCFKLALLEAASFLLTAGLYVLIIFFNSDALPAPTPTHTILLIASAVLSACGFFICICFPRRPEVFHEGRRVDGRGTVPALLRFTYSWPSDLLALSKAGKELDYEDLPTLDHYTRTRDLFNSFMRLIHRGSILKVLALSHIQSIVGQHVLTILDAVLMIAPQYVMYRLLRLLEARDSGADISTTSKFWVVALGLSILAGGFFNNWMWWICYNLNISVRAQLGGLIFAKSMRRKDVKGVVSSKENDAVVAIDPEEVDQAQPQAQPEKGKGLSAEEIEESINKTRQGVVNLIGVDAKRVADFSTAMNMFLGATCRLIFSFVFLGKLVGWQPLLAGSAVQLATLPLNIYFSKRYTDGQKILMERRDRKLAIINEALGGIRQIKFAALEKQWQKRIMDVRNDELGALWNTLLSDTVLISLWLAGPVLLSATAISVYAALHGGLPPSVAFTTISILGQIEGTLAWIPELTTNMLDAYVSLKRIGDYLDGPERVPVTIPGEQILFRDASITWPSEENDQSIFTLRDVNIAFPTGELSVISGKTGSGKSLLLAAILGEVEVISGTITVPQAPSVLDRHDEKANKSNWVLPNALAYVSQQPWIENASLRQNVLFGLPFNEERYKQVISACALEQDLNILTDGDATEIGANGINLSGGQRWRVTLARALYSRAGILVLDDIFSAVDAHVGKHIFENTLTGDICEGRTRILVTHHVSLCYAKTKYEVHLGNGTVEYAGFVSDIEHSRLREAIIDETDDEMDDETAENRLFSIKSAGSTTSKQSSKLDNVNGRANRRKRVVSISGKSDIIDEERHANNIKDAPKKFVEEETRETGWIKFSVYKAYLNACGGFPFWIVVAVAFGGFEALLLGRSWILRLWSEHYESESIFSTWFFKENVFVVQKSADLSATKVSSADLKFYLALYLGFAVAICVEGTLRYLWVFYGSIKASRTMFEKLTHAVLRAPLRWLDTMPVGRVLNRFTADFNQVDSGQAYSFAFCLYNFMLVIGIIIAGVIVSPYIIISAVVLLTICSRYALYYLSTARQTKRLESTAKSPVFELFSTALAGVGTLRAFDKTDTYIKSMFARLDTHARALYYQWLLNRWLSWRLNSIGAFFSFSVAALIVSLKGMDASLGGFALGFTLQYTEAVTWLLRNFAGVEIGMNAVERVIEYAEIGIEDQGGSDAPASWPTEGRLEVDNLVVGYAEDQPAVLKGLTFSVERNQRIGVVGRTGAGKSSLTFALFRFLEAREGTISIDGIDISKIKLHDLRSRLAIIPQDPVLFSGTVRSNLDPFDEHTDQELHDALLRVHLIDSSPSSGEASGTPSVVDTMVDEMGSSGSPIEAQPAATKNINLFTSLRSPISEGGLNLSQGQRQLLCLARAIVARPKIMVLDEATSAVDKATDALIQRSIREEFQDSTLIVIAHRLSTIVDFDRILVMSEGKVAEYDSPRNLLQIEDGIFSGMIGSSGESELLRGIITADSAQRFR